MFSGEGWQMTGSEYTEKIAVIVCGFDGSANARAAVEWAGLLADCCDSEVAVVGVYDWNPMLGESTNQEMIELRQEEIDAAAASALGHRGVRYRTIVETGDSRTVLLAVAQLLHAELLVVGSRGRSQLAEVVLGSVAHYLTHNSDIPVVVVPDRERVTG
jgi:nucleotide-binding universal stress UspA family protein